MSEWELFVFAYEFNIFPLKWTNEGEKLADRLNERYKETYVTMLYSLLTGHFYIYIFFHMKFGQLEDK